jgi:xanthine dehydrogenase YagT iron-sulfur-binding subunit
MQINAHRPLSTTTDVIGPGNATLTLHINQREYTISIEPCMTLLDTLREKIGLTGTKKGCNHGECGACTVLVDGKRINSCMTLAVMHENQEITTIEGVAGDDELHPLQQAFIQCDAFQCGYCTAGQIMSALGFLSEKHSANQEEIREWMSGNICRCGAYQNIVEAIQTVMQEGER